MVDCQMTQIYYFEDISIKTVMHFKKGRKQKTTC